MCNILTKGSTCSQKIIEIFVDLNRAGHDKSVKKKRPSTNIYEILADLRICFSCRHTIQKFDVKVYIQELQNKIDLSDIKSGNSLRNISWIALIFGTLTPGFVRSHKKP